MIRRAIPGRAALAVALLRIAGCCAIPCPPASVSVSEGEARAWRREDAALAADALARLSPRVAAILRVPPSPCIVVLDRREIPGPVDARTYDRAVVIGSEWRRKGLDWILAHELVHWHAVRSPSWCRLPQALEEGLADLVADLALGLRAFASPPDEVPKGDWPNVLRSKSRDLQRDSAASRRAHLLGRWVVARLGIDRTRLLAERARAFDFEEVPASWILEALRRP